MAEQEADRQTDIQALLAERKKFEAWIAQLDAKRENAASHVFERVHADYTKRLEDVRGRLRDEAETLRSLVVELEVRLGKEQERVTKKTDERAEAELRAMVGEFNEKEWTSTRSKLDSAVTDLRTKFDNTERELAELKELLASVTNAPAPARASVMMAAAVSVAEALDEAAAASAPAASKKEAQVHAKPAKGGPAAKAPIAEPITEPVPVRKSTPFDELAFLRSVAGTPSRPSGTAAVTKAPASAAAPAPAPVPPPPPEPVTPEPAADAEPIEGAVQDSVIESFAESEPETLEPSETPATSRGASRIVEADSGPLGAPTPRTSQAIRSLKCQECGTLNFPTEWYCERCGGELAAF